MTASFLFFRDKGIKILIWSTLCSVGKGPFMVLLPLHCSSKQNLKLELLFKGGITIKGPGI